MLGRDHKIFGYFGRAVTCRFADSDSESDQTTSQEQVGAEVGEGTAGGVQIAGASAQTLGPGSVHSNVTQGKNSTVNISSSDPDVVEAALAANVDVANGALTTNSDVSQVAITAAATTANNAITTIGNTTANDLAFGAASLAAAQASEDSATTETENLAAEYAAGQSQALDNAQTTANNLATGTTQGISQAQLPTNADEQGGGTINNLATWITVIAGMLAIYFYFRKGRG